MSSIAGRDPNKNNLRREMRYLNDDSTQIQALFQDHYNNN